MPLGFELAIAFVMDPRLRRITGWKRNYAVNCNSEKGSWRQIASSS